MKKYALFMFLSMFVAVSGCTSNPVRESVDPEEAARANAELGKRYMLQGNYEVAMDKLKRALSYDSHHVDANHFLALLYQTLGRSEDADEHFRRAVYYSEGEASHLHNNYGIFLCGQSRFDDGVEQLQKVLDNPVFPRRDQVFENIGLCYEGKGDSEKAEAFLRNALQVNPRTPKSLLAMARLTFEKKNYLSARAYLQRYSEVGRHTAESLWLGIQVERVLGDKNALSSYGLSLKGNFPDAPETKRYLETK